MLILRRARMIENATDFLLWLLIMLTLCIIDGVLLALLAVTATK